MGCSGSKVDDLPLVTLCRERKQLLKAAAEQRYALAAYHMLYFQSLKDVGEALRKFVDQELVVGGGTSPLASPVLTLPDEGKKKKNQNGSSSTSLSHSVSLSHHHSPDDQGSHLHLSTSDDSGSISDHNNATSTHIHANSDDQFYGQQGNQFYGQQGNQFYGQQENRFYGQQENGFYGQQGENNYFSPSRVNYYSNYMKRSSTGIPTVIHEDTTYYSYPQYGGAGGYTGVPMTSGSPDNSFYDPYRDGYNNRPQGPVVAPSPPPPPSPPRVSTWDFFNPFESLENSYTSYFPGGRYGVGSITSSPDSVEVRQREGIPDLEDDTEQEPLNEVSKEKQRVKEKVKGGSDEGTSRKEKVKGGSDEGTSRSVPLNEDKSRSGEETGIKSGSNESIVSTSTGEEEVATKSVSFEGDGQISKDGESSKSSSLTAISVHGTRDIQEVVQEIRDEFEIASDYGKEVAVMLEVGKLPYQPRGISLKVIFSRIHSMVSPPMLTSSHSFSKLSQHAALSVRKMAKVSYEELEDFQMKYGNLSLTLERLYEWERKLFKEVKDEERLRLIYEKKYKKLKVVDAQGDYDKTGATHESIRKLLTKINVAIRTVDAIAKKIHKLRDEELQPQITELINGLIRMWNSMLKCHQKQFQAITESKNRILMANIGSERDSSLRATVELELELRNWCTHFSNWINTQKAYVESLNEWLMRSLLKEPEVTADGIVPFSPSRVGAPPIFVVCNDWYHAMERLSEVEVVNTIHGFALSLHQLWERQDEEQRQRLNAAYLVKDFEKRLRTLRKEQGKMQRDRDALSDKSAMSVDPSESGVSPMDGLKVDLDSMRKRLEEEKAKHKATVKQVHEAASGSLHAGLIPIFEALGNFTSDTLKVYEHVRLKYGEAPEAS